MVVKTELTSFLRNKRRSDFNLKNVNYFTREITDDLRFVYAYTSEILQNVDSLGLYSLKKEGFVYVSNSRAFLAYGLPILGGNETLPTVENLRKEFKVLIRKEIKDYVDGNNIRRNDQNSLSNVKYQQEIEEKVVSTLVNNRKPSVRINLNSVDDLGGFSMDYLLSLLEDIYDKAYDEAERIIEDEIDYNNKLIFQKDVLNKYEEVIDDERHELQAKAFLKKLSYEYDSKSCKIIFKSLSDRIVGNELKINGETIKDYPVRNIEKIYFGRKLIYNSHEYNIGDIEAFEYWLNIDEKSAMYIPESLANDKSFILKLIQKFPNETNFYSIIGSKLFKDKKIIVELIKNNYDCIQVGEFYESLSNELKADIDVVTAFVEYKYNVEQFSVFYNNSIPEEIINNESFMDLIISGKDLYDINQLFISNQKLLDNSKIIQKLEESILDHHEYTYYLGVESFCSEILEKITNEEVVKKLILTDLLRSDEIKYLNNKVLNNRSVLDAIMVKRLGDSDDFTKIYTKLDNKIKNNSYVMAYLLYNFVDDSIERAIEETIGLESFKKNTGLQKDFIHCALSHGNGCSTFLDLCSTDVVEEFVFDKKQISFYSYISGIKKFNEPKLLKIIEDDPKQLRMLQMFSDKTKYSDNFVKECMKRMPGFVDRVGSGFNYSCKNIAKIVSEEESIIPYIWDKKSLVGKHEDYLIDDSELVINCLKHNFSHFTMIEKPVNIFKGGHSVLNNKDFIINCVNTFSSLQQLTTIIGHLQSKKIPLIRDPEMISKFLSKDFGTIKCFTRTFYNDEDLIITAIKKSKNSKDYIVDSLKSVNSKLLKSERVKKLLKIK